MARDVNVGPAAEKKLERYGVWVKVEPRDIARDLGSSFELTDLEPQPTDASTAPSSTLTDEEEHLLDELETGVGHEVATGTQVELEALDERMPESSAEEELPELELDEAVEVPLAGDKPGGASFDDLEALDEGITPTPGVTAHQPEILARIEKELHSIRTDLLALKKELADLRRPPAGTAPIRAPAGEKAKFFEEEEDDTIALTGDELDNILNTADITEEAAEAPAVEADLADLDESPLSTGEDLLAYEEPSAAAAPAAAPGEPSVELEEPLEELEEVSDLELELPGDAPAELVLEDAGSTPEEAGELPTLDLEGVPEIEGAGEAELEELPADEGLTADAEVEEAPAAAPGKKAAFEDIDLKALAATQDSGEESALSAEDLEASDLAELEAVAEEPAQAGGAAIEIDFENLATPSGTNADVAVETLEPVEELEEVVEALEEPHAAPAPRAEPTPPARQPESTPAVQAPVMTETLKNDLRNVLGVIDELLDALPEKKIKEFAKSEHFAVYKKLFDDLGLSKQE
jgi:pilus assembly protein FimV